MSSIPAFPIASLRIAAEQDVVRARQLVRELARHLGFSSQDQSRIATSVSEIVRNAFRYAGGGEVEFALAREPVPCLRAKISDAGPGIPHLQDIWEGRYRSRTGMGMGLAGARRLMDVFDIRTGSGSGTDVLIGKVLPAGDQEVSEARALALRRRLSAGPDDGAQAVHAVIEQNQELLATLAALQQRQEELARLTRELEDTNRGVVALYAELEEKAEHLRRADAMKTRFLSNMTHEFRTPLSSMKALGRLLLAHTDGPLSEEQEKQVRLMVGAADELSILVDDLLDLAKIEAGKVDVHPGPVSLHELFSALRGMLKPLLTSKPVELVFEDVRSLPPLRQDEAKLAQVLRNFISNALKFTERGEVRVGARPSEDGSVIEIFVSDTGIGIAEEDLERIFEEFGQVQNRLQKHVKGTGLGLPLCTKLAHLLGGTVRVKSVLGQGSTFSLAVPASLGDVPDERIEVTAADDEALGVIPVVVIQDEEQSRRVYEHFLAGTRYRPVWAANTHEAAAMVDTLRPCAVLLDLRLKGEDAWRWLAQQGGLTAYPGLPLIAFSNPNEEARARALGADACFSTPVPRDALLRALDELTAARIGREQHE